MGPKKDKDLLNENYWRTCIETAPLDDQTWKVRVVLIEPAGSEQDRIYLNKFEVFSSEEKRFVVKIICKTETIFMVNQLGGEKKVKDDNLRVFEEGQLYLKDKKDIPPDILALIIKHLILKMKEEYLIIKQQRLVVKEGMRRESTTMVERVEVKGIVNVKPPESIELSPPSKGKGNKGEPDALNQVVEPDEGKKYNTSLRVRGEEWRDKVYIDDFPSDGPDIYVAITGFGEPYLVPCLINIGVPLSAIIQVKIDPQTGNIPSSLFRATKRGQSQTEILTEKSLKFWEDLQQLRIHNDYADVLKKTAFIIFKPPYSKTNEITGDPNKIYDELCYLMYDVQDLTRQHEHYLENMEIIHMPYETLQEPLISYYHQQIDEIPLECVTTFSILDSMLQSVSKYQNPVEESSTKSLSTTSLLKHYKINKDDKFEVAESLIKDIFDSLCKTDLDKKSYRITYGTEYEDFKDPKIIKHGQFAKYSTFHLGNINLDNIIKSTLIGMPVNKLWLFQNRQKAEVEAKINFHVNVLLSCFERQDVETAELTRLIHILAFRKLYNNRSSLKRQQSTITTITEFKKVYLKRTLLAEPLVRYALPISRSHSSSFPSITKSENSSSASYGDDPETRRIRFLFECPDLSELVSATEIANDKPKDHVIDEFEYFEDLSGTASYESLYDAYNKFNCVDYKYCEVTDCLILMFYNSYDKNGIAREEWRGHLPTPLSLQDFFDFVLEENYDWIQNEEKRYDENMMVKSPSMSKHIIDQNAMKSCIDEIDLKQELLIEGSLKYHDTLENEEEEEEEEESLGAGAIELKKVTTSAPSDMETKSSRKTKSPAFATPKNLRQSFLAPFVVSETSIDVIKKPFLGYDLSNRRVEVFGKDNIYFSKDGTQVSIKYLLYIPTNLEYITLNIVSGNKNNEIWLHRALGESVSSAIRESCESIRISSFDGVMINLKKRTYQIPILVCLDNEIHTQKENKLKSPSEKDFSMPILYETKSFHSLYVTWPNGLITETIHECNSSPISHIKQYYMIPQPHLNETMRCISLNGEVIIFKQTGLIEVLNPNGSYIKIIKCEKAIIKPPTFDEVSEMSSEKDKKEKSKDKPSKTSSKSSKMACGDNEKQNEVNHPEYELKIREYEFIDTSGLRQRWLDDKSFDIDKLLIKTATDHCLGEVFSKRMDGTNILLNSNGTRTVTFPNKTRIISEIVVEPDEIFPEWTEEEKETLDMLGLDDIGVFATSPSKQSVSQSYGTLNNSETTSTFSTKNQLDENGMESKEKLRDDGYISIKLTYTIEHANFTTVIINKSNGNITLNSPNKTSLTVNTTLNYFITLDNSTTANFNGELLNIVYNACFECNSKTTCSVKTSSEVFDNDKINQNWLKLRDSSGKKIIVNKEGSIIVCDDLESDEVILTSGLQVEESITSSKEKCTSRKSENSLTSHGKCNDIYAAKYMKFFVLRRELTCSELVHKTLLEQYQQECRWQPWCSITEHDTFGDNRTLVSILTPVNITETEKWLMESILPEKPSNLTFKDLKNDDGKGFYHWMRPYERYKPNPMKPPNVLPPRLPRAFIQRTLEHQWKESQRSRLKGAKELLVALLKYRQIMEAETENILNIPIIDLRNEDERRTDEIIQALGHRVYEDLKYRLYDELQTRVALDITTSPQPLTDKISMEGESGEENMEIENKTKLLEEERASLLAEVNDAEKMSANLERYWRRRAEEYNQEQFYRYLLRDGSVPPYFGNLLGGAIWWEMNNTTTEAVTSAERKKMKCVCAEKSSSYDRRS